MVTTRRRAYEPADSKPPKRRKTNHNSVSIRFSRACQICTADEPRYLSVMTPCGHAICRACSLRIRAEEDSSNDGVAVPRESRDREVTADEERISASDEDRVLAEAVAAWAILPDVRQAACAARKAALEATTKNYDLAVAASAAAEAILAGLAADLARYDAQIVLRRSDCPVARAEAAEEIARCDAILSEQTIEQRKAARDEIDAKKKAANAEREPLFAVEKEAERKEDECEMKIEQIENMIKRFARENEESAARGLRFSRACRACSTESPPLRSFFPACGHAVCRECADRASASEADTKCPTCHKDGRAIYLFEELADSV